MRKQPTKLPGEPPVRCSAWSDINSPTSKHPLGLRPRWIAEEQRLIEVASAVSRYLDAGKTVPASWLEELVHLVGSLEHWRAWKQRDGMMSNESISPAAGERGHNPKETQ